MQLSKKISISLTGKEVEDIIEAHLNQIGYRLKGPIRFDVTSIQNNNGLSMFNAVNGIECEVEEKK